MFDFNIERSIKAKNLFKNTDNCICKIWHDYFAPSNVIGNCSHLYDLLHPCSSLDFFNKVTQYASKNTNLPKFKRGLSEDELFELAKQYKELVEKKHPHISFDLNTYWDEMLCHIFIETVQGKLAENELFCALLNKGWKVEIPYSKRLDSCYGIDIIVKDARGRFLFFIQVKPISFLTNNRHDTKQDQKGMIYKYHKAHEKFGKPTYYTFYRLLNDGTFLWGVNEKSGKILFKLEEIFEFTINNDIVDNVEINKIDKKYKKITEIFG